MISCSLPFIRLVYSVLNYDLKWLNSEIPEQRVHLLFRCAAPPYSIQIRPKAFREKSTRKVLDFCAFEGPGPCHTLYGKGAFPYRRRMRDNFE